MDCGLRRRRQRRVHTVPVSDVKAGDQIVCGAGGVKVVLPPREHKALGEHFEFMASTVSSEKPQALLVRQIAERMREVKGEGGRILWVGRPGGRAHRRVDADGRAGRGRLGRRSLRRQRAGDTRHRVVAVRHVARRRPRARRTASSTATSTTSARSTRSARPARSSRRSTTACSPTASCTRWCKPDSRSCWSGRCATTGRCRTSTPT